MADYVIDTNVWVMVDKIANIGSMSITEIDCIAACRNWLQAFANSDDKLIVDGFASRKILNEYRARISQRGLARDLLNRLERLPRERIIDVDIEFDTDGFAVLPNEFQIVHNKDRKLVAVALAYKPTPTIVNATDTDREKEKARLQQHGIIVQELCPEYIQEKLN